MQNTVLCGDVCEVAKTLTDNSICLVLCSPPYANQRSKWYPSVNEKDYPAWTVRWLEALRSKLTADANILIIIRARLAWHQFGF